MFRIKTNTTGAEFLYLPLEVEVTSQPGLYCPQEMIDFGLVPSDSGPQTLELLLINSGRSALTVSSVVATPVTDNLNIEFSSVKIPPDTIRPSVITKEQEEKNWTSPGSRRKRREMRKQSPTREEKEV